MSHTLMSLDVEWRRLARSSRARRALKQWSIPHPALRGLADLDALLERRRDDHAAPAVLRALAVLAPGDDLAARTLLQALLPGLVRLAGMVGYDDPAAIEEMVSLAWERIRTYPPSRRGSVAANVLFDVRKRYRAHRLIEAPRSRDAEEVEASARSRSPEDEAVARVLFEQLMAAQRDEQVLRDGAFRLVLRTRLAGEPLTEVAEMENLPLSVLAQRRWRAECRLRQLPLARGAALDPAATRSVADDIVRREGGIDVSFDAPSNDDVQGTLLIDLSVDELVQPVEKALRTRFATTHCRGWTHAGTGVIVTVTGGCRESFPSLGGTVVAWAALEALFRQWACKLGSHGVRVAWLRTTGIAEAIPDTGDALAGPRHRFRRGHDPRANHRRHEGGHAARSASVASRYRRRRGVPRVRVPL